MVVKKTKVIYNHDGTLAGGSFGSAFMSSGILKNKR